MQIYLLLVQEVYLLKKCTHIFVRLGILLRRNAYLSGVSKTWFFFEHRRPDLPHSECSQCRRGHGSLQQRLHRSRYCGKQQLTFFFCLKGDGLYQYGLIIPQYMKWFYILTYCFLSIQRTPTRPLTVKILICVLSTCSGIKVASSTQRRSTICKDCLLAIL